MSTLCPHDGEPDVLHAPGADQGIPKALQQQRGKRHGVHVHPHQRWGVWGPGITGAEEPSHGAREGLGAWPRGAGIPKCRGGEPGPVR